MLINTILEEILEQVRVREIGKTREGVYYVGIVSFE